MATVSTTTQLTDADKKSPDFLVRLLTEPGNDEFRDKIYNELIANKDSATNFNIITYEHIMTAIAGNYNKTENILEEAAKLMVLVFKDFAKNTAARFGSIVNRMTTNADAFVSAATGGLAMNINSTNVFHAKASAVLNKLNPDEAKKFYKPRPDEPPPTSSSTALVGSATTPPPAVEADPRIDIYMQSLAKIKRNLESIKKYEAKYVGTFNQEDVSDVFNISTFFANLDSQVDKIKTNINTAGVAEINTMIEEYIKNIKSLEKIKKVVRNLDIESNILFFQFSILQNTNNRTSNEASRIAGVQKDIDDIVKIRKEVITSLIDKQNKVKELIRFLEKITKKILTELDKFTNKNQIITKLSDALTEIMTLPMVNKKEDKGLEEAKNKIYTTIRTIQKNIQKNSDTDNIKNIKIDMLDRINQKLSTKTSEATKARETANPKLSTKPSYVLMLEYADAAFLSDKLIPYVTQIMASIQTQSLNAESLALPSGTLDILPDDIVRPMPQVRNPEITAEEITDRKYAINTSESPIQTSYDKFIPDYPFLDNSVIKIQDDLEEFKVAVNNTSSAEKMLKVKMIDDAVLLETFGNILDKRIEIIKVLIKETSDIKDTYVEKLRDVIVHIESYRNAKTSGTDVAEKEEKEELVNESLNGVDVMEQKFQIIFKALNSDYFIGQDVLDFQIINDDQKEELSQINREMIEAIGEMEKQKKKYEDMKSSPAPQLLSARQPIASTPRGPPLNLSDTAQAEVASSTIARLKALMSELNNTYMGPLLDAQEEDGGFGKKVKQAIDNVHYRISPAFFSFNYTSVSSNDPEVLKYKDKVAIYKELLEKAESALNEFNADLTSAKNISGINATDIKPLDAFNSEATTLLTRYHAEYNTYDGKLQYITGRLDKRQSDKKTGDLTPRESMIQGGGTRRGGKRFNKKTIKKNLVHKKTFKNNIVHNKIVKNNIVKNKTGKNNIVKNNIVKNNIVKNKTVHKNHLKRKQTHKNN